MSEDIKTEEKLTEETVQKAIEVLEKAVNSISKKTNTFKVFNALKERRSGDERRQDLLAPYFRAFVKKMLENISSAKMLMFFLPLLTSAFFLYVLFGMRDEFLDFATKHPNAVSDASKFFEIAMDGFISWCTFTVSLGGTIIVVRETFKVSKLKALTGDKETDTEIEKIQN